VVAALYPASFAFRIGEDYGRHAQGQFSCYSNTTRNTFGGLQT